MDAWAALWFWPLTDTDGAIPPTLDQWIGACQQLLGREPEARKNSKGMTTLGAATNWEDLNDAEELNLDFAGAVNVDDVLDKYTWLKVCESVAEQQGFFHWGLDFATVFARGGFDLQLGNPPWMRPRTDVDALLAEGDPWWQLTTTKPSEALRQVKRESTLAIPGILDLAVGATADIVVNAEYLNSTQAYPLVSGLQPDLYRCFMERTWSHCSAKGITTLVHPETHFTDDKAAWFRENTYIRLRRSWQFINELMLYEIDHKKRYGIHVYSTPTKRVDFLTASSLYHPDTVARSIKHDGTGEEPGIKDSVGHWDLRPHRNRIIVVTDTTLQAWHAVMEDDSIPVRQTRMVYTVNRAVNNVLETLAGHPRTSLINLDPSRGWDESIDPKNGYFESEWGAPRSWNQVILQGPHIHVSTPLYKFPNETLKNNQDWSFTDFEKLDKNVIPTTSFKPAIPPAEYNEGYIRRDPNFIRSSYRAAWRRMGKIGNERTLIPAIIPPEATHVDGIFSARPSNGDQELTCTLAAFLSSLISDFLVRTFAKQDIRLPSVNRLPLITRHPLRAELILRVLRLNCVTSAYASLWGDVYNDEFINISWTGGLKRANRPALGRITREWTDDTPLRIAEDRRQALVEIDALVALMLGVTVDQLCTIYRTQFAVLYGYDHKEYVYDANGRLVPN